MEFNIPLGKVIRVFTSTNLCVTGEFSGIFNDTLLMKDCAVKTAIDYDNTFFSILGVIEKCEKQGILLKDQNNKEQFICFPNILEVQYLGTDDWPEYERPDISEILNLSW